MLNGTCVIITLVMPSNGDQDDFDSELDLLKRYEQMIETQIETINGIDNKAANTGRLIGVLSGLLLTAASIAVSTSAIEFTEATVGAFLMLGIGVAALFASLVFAIITYLSSKFVYGPPAGLGEYMADYRVDSQEYRDALLRGYSTGISANRRVVDENSKRFKRCLTALLVALLFLFGSGILLVLPENHILDGAVILVFTITALLLARYIVREEYLTLENEHTGNE